jgi:hypothetical protein
MYASVIYYFLFVSSLGIHYYSYSFVIILYTQLVVGVPES